jgi:Ca2+-binding EF-hand superfamily protein
MGSGCTMGSKDSKLPPVEDRDLKVICSYNLKEQHIKKLHAKFVDIDVNLNGVWTVDEVYALMKEQRLSIRAAIIDRIFFMGDGPGEGSMPFQDFLVCFTSFCALTRAEVLQLFFIILDQDRSGTIEKEEMLRFFSYVPKGYKDVEPLFPVNNKNALDKFKRGHWNSLEFDGLAQLCDHFPYISYPAFHVQERLRELLLGKAFWEQLDRDRTPDAGTLRKTRRVQLPGSKELVEVQPPKVCTMQEFLEYSRRKTKIMAGKRVSQEGSTESASPMAIKRDEELSASPLSNMIRNPLCMYHVPYAASKPIVKKEEGPGANMELELLGSMAPAANPDEIVDEADDLSRTVDDSDDDDDDDEQDD